MEAEEHPNDGKDPLLGGLAGLPRYPSTHLPVVEKNKEWPTEPVLSRRRFLRRALVTALAIPPVAAAAGLGYVGFFGEDPEERVRRYRSPRMGEPVVLGTRERYPYTRSALRIHAEEEVRLTPERFDHVAELCTIADNIADCVAVRMKELHQSDSVTDALHSAGESEENLLQYACAIAAALRHSGCFYQPEGSLANAVDPAHPRPPQASYHLDCDLLCLIALHAASRHDIPLHAVGAPSHMYLGSPHFPDFACEMTAFRNPIPQGRSLGRGLRWYPQWEAHSAFASSHDAQHGLWTFAPGVRPQQFGFFQPTSEEELHEGAIGSVLYEMLGEKGQDRYYSYDRLRMVGRIAVGETQRRLRGRMIPAALYVAQAGMRDYIFGWWMGHGDDEWRRIAREWAQYVYELGLHERERVGNIPSTYDERFLHHLEHDLRFFPPGILQREGMQWWPAH